MLAQFVYCPRLFYYMHVDGLMAANAPVWRGRQAHKRVDRTSHQASRRTIDLEEEEGGPPQSWSRRTALDLGDDELGLVGSRDADFHDNRD